MTLAKATTMHVVVETLERIDVIKALPVNKIFTIGDGIFCV